MTTDILTESIRQAVRQPDVQEALSRALEGQIRALFAGTELYIRRNSVDEQEARDQRIWAAFTGNNYADLARGEGLSGRQVRRIIGRMRSGAAKP